MTKTERLRSRHVAASDVAAGGRARRDAWRRRVAISASRGRRSTSGNGDLTRPAPPACATGRATPQRSPRATTTEVVSKILYLREQYHFGPGQNRRLSEAVSSGGHCAVVGAPASSASTG